MAMKFDSGFEVLRFSDLQFEKMTAEIQYMGEQIGQVNMDRGIENLEIELFTEFAQQDFVPKFPLAALMEALDAATKVLRDYESPRRP